MGDYFYWFSLGTALALIGLVILSVVFAPIAVATCVVIARVRGLPALQHGVAGGLCAASLFLPWAYLVLRMLDKRPPKGLVGPMEPCTPPGPMGRSSGASVHSWFFRSFRCFRDSTTNPTKS